MTPNPTLMAADPGAMMSAAQAFTAAAHQMYEIFQTTSTASGMLLADWRGKGAQGFNNAAETTNTNAQTAAQAMIGAGDALTVLAGRIAAAQATARQAIALAASTNESSARLATSYEASRQEAIAALPANATPEQQAALNHPTPAQSSQADALANDGVRAQQIMTDANNEARLAWRQAAVAFDAVTAQSPRVQNALLSARVKAFGNSMDSIALASMAMFISGTLAGETPDGDDEEEDGGLTLDDPAIAKAIDEGELDAGAGMNLDGTKIDEAIAVDGNSMVAVDAEDAEQGALGDPVGGTVLDNPSEPLSSSRFPYLQPNTSEPNAGAIPGEMPPSEAQLEPVPEGWTAPPEKALANFTGTVSPTAAVSGVTYYRAVGEGNSPDGSWWTTTPPTASDRPGLAIDGTWNSMTGVVEFTPAEGEVIPAWQGAAAPQQVTMPDGKIGYFPGGAGQIWVPKGAFNDNNGNFTIQPMRGGG